MEIFPIAQEGTLIGWGSCEINGLIRLSGIALHITKEGKLKINFPAKKVGKGLSFYFQPLNPDMAEKFRLSFKEKAKEVGLLVSNEKNYRK